MNTAEDNRRRLALDRCRKRPLKMVEYSIWNKWAREDGGGMPQGRVLYSMPIKLFLELL